MNKNNKSYSKGLSIRKGIVYGIGRCTESNIVIPDSAVSIRRYAFDGCGLLESVIIPDSVTSIDTGAFNCCYSLKSIVIPDSVTSIEGSAFWNCSSLESIKVSENNPVYDSRENCNAIIETGTGKLIAGCSNTFIPDSVTSIGNWAFRGCDSLKSIIIPNSVTSIGNSTFDGCSSLESVTIPDSVTSIDSFAFYDCKNLMELRIPKTVTEIGCSIVNKAFTEIVYSGTKEMWKKAIGNNKYSGSSIVFEEFSYKNKKLK